MTYESYRRMKMAEEALRKAAEGLNLNFHISSKRKYFIDLFREFLKAEMIAKSMSEAGYLNLETFEWIDSGRPEGIIASIILACNDAKLFLKQDLKTNDFIDIALKSFGVEISAETFKKKKKTPVDFKFSLPD
jgi:hypothetical protein